MVIPPLGSTLGCFGRPRQRGGGKSEDGCQGGRDFSTFPLLAGHWKTSLLVEVCGCTTCTFPDEKVKVIGQQSCLLTCVCVCVYVVVSYTVTHRTQRSLPVRCVSLFFFFFFPPRLFAKLGQGRSYKVALISVAT